MGKLKKTFRTRAQPKNFKINTESKKSQTKKKITKWKLSVYTSNTPKNHGTNPTPKKQKGLKNQNSPQKAIKLISTKKILQNETFNLWVNSQKKNSITIKKHKFRKKISEN